HRFHTHTVLARKELRDVVVSGAPFIETNAVIMLLGGFEFTALDCLAGIRIVIQVKFLVELDTISNAILAYKLRNALLIMKSKNTPLEEPLEFAFVLHVHDSG